MRNIAHLASIAALGLMVGPGSPVVIDLPFSPRPARPSRRQDHDWHVWAYRDHVERRRLLALEEQRAFEREYQRQTSPHFIAAEQKRARRQAKRLREGRT